MMEPFVYLERAIMQRLVQRYQRRTLRRAARRAYAEFARKYPNWTAALFDEHFVSNHLLPLLHKAAASGDKISALQVADLWVRQVSLLPSHRQKHSAAFLPAATHFLCLLSRALADAQVVGNAPALVESAVG